jgi:hypothetical protein
MLLHICVSADPIEAYLSICSLNMSSWGLWWNAKPLGSYDVLFENGAPSKNMPTFAFQRLLAGEGLRRVAHLRP